MVSAIFSYPIKSSNINKIFMEDFKIIKALNKEPKKCFYDFKKQIRILEYTVKNKEIAKNLCGNAKKSKVKSLKWKLWEMPNAI